MKKEWRKKHTLAQIEVNRQRARQLFDNESKRTSK
jgi:hypothetical protein